MANGLDTATTVPPTAEGPGRYQPFRVRDVCLIILIVGGSHLAYRTATLGLPPFTDGGAHVCYGYFARSGTPSTVCHPINLYPALVSSVGLDGEAPFLRVRLVDGFICAVSVSISALLVYRLSSRSTAVLLGLLWSIGWLHLAIGNAGFKNAIVPAFGLISASLLLWTFPGRATLFAGGMLVPLIALVREPLAVTALVLWLSVAALRGCRALLVALSGGMVSGAVLLVWVWLYRGAPLEVLARYQELGRMFQAFSHAYMPPAAESLRDSLRGSLPAGVELAVAGALGLAAWSVYVLRARRSSDWRWALIAGMLLAFPLLEILFKAPFPYHWMQLGLGLMLFSALGYRVWHQGLPAPADRVVKFVTYGLLGLLLCVQLGTNRPALTHGLAQSKYFESVMVEGNWDHFSVSDSLYLRLAKYLRDQTRPEDRVFVSGFYYVLYPLSQRLPPAAEYHDATFASLAGLHETRAVEMASAFHRHPPRVIVESLRWQDTRQRIALCVPQFPAQYELVAELPNDLPIHYGEFGARIWRRRELDGEQARELGEERTAAEKLAEDAATGRRR